MPAAQRHKGDTGDSPPDKLIGASIPGLQDLLALRPHRDHQAPSFGQLVQQGLRHTGRAGRHDDACIGSGLGPSERAIAHMAVHVAEP